MSSLLQKLTIVFVDSIIKELLGDLIKRSVEKKSPKLMLRRYPSKAKMLFFPENSIDFTIKLELLIQMIVSSSGVAEFGAAQGRSLEHFYNLCSSPEKVWQAKNGSTPGP